MNLSNVMIGVLFVLIITLIVLGFSLYFRQQEKELFNKGNCIECNVPFQRVGNDTKIRIYYCPKCHSMMAIYFNVDKNVQLTNYKMTEDEDEEMVDSSVGI